MLAFKLALLPAFILCVVCMPVGLFPPDAGYADLCMYLHLPSLTVRVSNTATIGDFPGWPMGWPVDPNSLSSFTSSQQLDLSNDKMAQRLIAFLWSALPRLLWGLFLGQGATSRLVTLVWARLKFTDDNHLASAGVDSLPTIPPP